MAHRPAVSVIVPVFSPGPYIRPLLDCLDRQRAPDGGFESLLVDDGSSDATPALLQRWAGSRPWATVIPLPPSGWPSRPRNVGIERARGEFVFFVDHDDWLADDALARMTAFARENQSDVVIGWMQGLGRRVPVKLFARTVPDAHPPRTPLQDSMTVHAMFRTSFLHSTGLRFDESVRRLEDHLFMATAYTRARRVSVLADAPVYLHALREDSENAGYRPYGAEEYYSALGRAVDVVLSAQIPSDERDAYLRRWIRGEMLDRLRSEMVRSLPPAERQAFFIEIQRLMNRMPEETIRTLPATYRERAERLRRTTSAAHGAPAEHEAADVAADVAAGERGTRGRLLDAVSRGGPRLRRRLVRWGRSPAALRRDAARVGAVASAVVAAILVGVAPAASVGLVAASTALTAWLAVRSLGPWPTALRQLLALTPAGISAVVETDVVAGAVTLAAAALVVIGVAADRRWRRTDVRGYPARSGGPLDRLGYIGVTAIVIGAGITAAVAVAVLR
jgi:glycosyltransferase involved in cell wall biosynthesis